MNFDLYRPFKDKKGVIKPGIRPLSLSWTDIKKEMSKKEVVSIINEIRSGKKDRKTHLPSICFVGKTTKTRAAANMVPTQLVMIDIDHVENPREAWKTLVERIATDNVWMSRNLILVHITCSGKGLRIVFKAQEGFTTLIDNMNWFSEKFFLSDFGDVDTACKDFSRISFICLEEDVLYESAYLFFDEEPEFEERLKNEAVPAPSNPLKAMVEETSAFTKDEEEEFDNFDYRGTPVKVIVNKYLEVYGEPSSGEIHNFYNEMVKNFRTICSNNKRLLLYLLPRFGHTMEECWRQIVSI